MRSKKFRTTILHKGNPYIHDNRVKTSLILITLYLIQIKNQFIFPVSTVGRHTKHVQTYRYSTEDSNNTKFPESFAGVEITMQEQRKINRFAAKSIDSKYLLPFEQQAVILFDIVIPMSVNLCRRSQHMIVFSFGFSLLLFFFFFFLTLCPWVSVQHCLILEFVAGSWWGAIPFLEDLLQSDIFVAGVDVEELVDTPCSHLMKTVRFNKFKWFYLKLEDPFWK